MKNENFSWPYYVTKELSRVTAQGLRRKREIIRRANGVNIQIDDRALVNFSSNDYLGMASHYETKRRALKISSEFGLGSGASHLISGHYEVHSKVEKMLAHSVGAQKAVLFANGYMANLAIISAFLSKGDLLLQDKLNHASLIDGAKLSSATLRRYVHGDLGHAFRLFKSQGFNRCMLATDGVFSMDGDLAPLDGLINICDDHQALLVVDDAHGFGVLGGNGGGALESFGYLPSGNILMMATLGKALGCYGAFVAGDAHFIDYLIQFARPYMYTTSLPPSVVASVLAVLLTLEKNGVSMRGRLNANIDHFRKQAIHVGLPLLDSKTAIQPLILQVDDWAVKLSNNLRQDGFYVCPIRPPTVRKGTARLRIALSAQHTHQQIDLFLESLAKHYFEIIAQ